MNATSIINKAHRLTNKNDTTFMDGVTANVLAELNTCYGHRVLDVLKVRQDVNSFIHEETTTFFADQNIVEGDIGWNGEYPFDTQMLRPIRIEVSYDGLTWVNAKIYDINENPNSEHDASDIASTFSKQNPYVRFERNSYIVRPTNTGTSDILKGLHAWWENRQSDLVSLTADYPDFEDNLHDILSYDLANLERVMHPDKYAADWRNDFDATYQRINERFDDFYKNRMKKNFVVRTAKESYN